MYTSNIDTRGDSTCPPGRVLRQILRVEEIDYIFSVETGMIKFNFSQTHQKQPGIRPGRQALDEPAVYEFKVAPSLSNQWSAWFDGLNITCDEQGNTLLSGIIVDQSALHGVLVKIRDLNLVLLSVLRK